jgi:hypothetical protein
VNKIESENFVKSYMHKLWKKWEVNDEVLDLWQKVLTPFSWPVARRAADECKMDSPAKEWEPSTKDFRKAAFRIKEKTGSAETTAKLPLLDPTYFVICVEAGPHCTVGTIQPVILSLTEEFEDHTVLLAAEATKAKLEAAYGGMWKVYNITRSMTDQRTAEYKARVLLTGEEWHDDWRITPWTIAAKIAKGIA